MSQCGSVGMDRYWNYIATPLFFIVIAFGMFALFTASDIQTIDTDSLKSVVAAFSSASGSTPASVAAPNSGLRSHRGGPGVIAQAGTV
jgi:hypothetical protein